MSTISNPMIRYWIRLNKHSIPIETDNPRNLKNELSKSPSAMMIVESIYPNAHEFRIADTHIKERIDRELSDAKRSDTATRIFNKFNQYDSQVMRKKTSRAKSKSKRK
jgi:hypothetical protein